MYIVYNEVVLEHTYDIPTVAAPVNSVQITSASFTQECARMIQHITHFN